MQDSDDNYFSDDLVLDDQTIAVLDEEESRFKRNTTSTSQTQRYAGPPPKRQKTTAAWQPQSVNKTFRRTDTLDDLDDLPDVSVRHDGTYNFQDKQRPPASMSRAGVAPRPPALPPVSRPTTIAPTSRGSVPPIRSASVSIPVRPTQPQSRPPPSRGTRVTPSPAPSQGISRTQSPSLSQGVSRSQPRPPHPPQPSQPPQRVASTSSATVSDTYVPELRRQIEELRKERDAKLAEMESVLEAKFSKEGEVTILRKRLEKTAQEHSAQIAKLKAAKEESDAKHLVLQKQYEVEKERLKTELTFRRHELETSTRKPPMSHLSKNGASQAPQLVPSQMPRWDQSSTAGPSRVVPESSQRPRFGVISDFEKSKKSTVETRGLPSGFQTGPPRSQRFVSGRNVEETSLFLAPHESFHVPAAVPPSQGSSSQIPQPDIWADQMDDSGAIDSFISQPDIGNNGVNLMDNRVPATTPTAEDPVVALLPSWNVVLHGVILTHVPRGSKTPTLQLLVSASIADTQQLQFYSAALMRIFHTLGRISNHPEESFEHLARVICSALCEIAHILTSNNLITPLTALLNLLINLSCMLPSFHAILLPQRVEHEEPPQLLGVLYLIIQDQLQSLNIKNGEGFPELSALGRETLSLFNALVWRALDDLEDSLSISSIDPSLFMTLLQHDRPMWFLIESMRVLLWLSTRRSLFHSLLSNPENEKTVNNNGSVDPVQTPLIDRACSLLTDIEHKGPEADELKRLIIMFLGILSSSHPDAYSLLVEAEVLIPSIILSLNQLVIPIWDEDEALFNDPQVASRTIRIINHATLLLHHLVMGENATLDLRDRLCRSPMKIYPGLIHLFIMTFGRLSYATPPRWLDATDRNQLLQVTELARPLLELAIQGPELDSIWETYHDEGEENDEAAMDVDDEEVEAQKFADL